MPIMKKYQLHRTMLVVFVVMVALGLAGGDMGLQDQLDKHHTEQQVNDINKDQGTYQMHQTRFDRNHIQDHDHIMEHMDGMVNKPETEMSEEELQFHYFKLHDYDNNNKLDGIEIANAMTHYHKDEKEEDGQEKKSLTDEDIASVIDTILTDEDKNNDGYIDYTEFVIAQRGQEDGKEEAKKES